MNANRYVAQGKRLDNGELITGYPCLTMEQCPGTGHRHLWGIQCETRPNKIEIIPVDPATVEPVAAEIVPLDTNNKFRKKYQCPNCNGLLVFDCIEYCHGCGQRLDWTKAVSEEGKV